MSLNVDHHHDIGGPPAPVPPIAGGWARPSTTAVRAAGSLSDWGLRLIAKKGFGAPALDTLPPANADIRPPNPFDDNPTSTGPQRSGLIRRGRRRTAA